MPPIRDDGSRSTPARLRAASRPYARGGRGPRTEPPAAGFVPDRLRSKALSPQRVFALRAARAVV
ncbi:hypothetical protein SAMN05216258_102161 [Albimonas pacifica]|uniref:Uncharacterized protein n=1 Tax=Albimonas pacifica TaxID=1114924 RepID=A0A1I3CRY0_9RHOB|nr:hypothetical protein SAMN05216258_102161 [Albimonas pacifica]